MTRKTLYLTSSESQSFAVVRRIDKFDWRRVGDREYLLVETDIPVNLSTYELSDVSEREFYLSNRFVEEREAFRSLESFPIYVNVWVPRPEINGDEWTQDDLFNLAWATLYDNLIDAEEKRW